MFKKSIFLLFILLTGFQLSAHPYRISYLTAEDGLSRNFIDHIFRDSRGFMWFSTSKGLDRYDGYEFIHFDSRHAVNPLVSDNVHCVSEDVHGNLWIGTENGLYFLNYTSGKITNAPVKLKSRLSALSGSINFIIPDEQKNLWIGSNNSILLISFVNNEPQIQEVYSSVIPIGSLLIYEENILVGAGNEIFRLIKKEGGTYQRVNAGDRLKQLAGTVLKMYYDNGLIWIGTNTGLYKYEPTTERIQSYKANGAPGQLSSDFITDIAKIRDGQLMVGTLIGLNTYDYLTDKFTVITSEPDGRNFPLSNNFVNCLLVDNDKIWVGTEKGGVNLLIPSQSVFTNFEHSATNAGTLSPNPVNAIYEDNDGDLMVGTVEGGLNILRKGATGFQHFYAEASPASLSHNSVSYICQDFNGDYWIGTWGRGLNKLNKNNKLNPRFTQFANNGNSTDLESNFVSYVVSDANNRGIWIGTLTGVDFMDVASGKITHIMKHLPADKRIANVTGMALDSKNRLWIGTGAGLYCVLLNETNLKTNKISFRYFRYLLTNPGSKIIEKINCILETKEKKIWFGSYGNGIYRLDEENGEMHFTNFDESKGLLDNVVYSMLEDETGTIWMSTDKGLCAFDDQKNSIRSYIKSDGLISNQFYWNASCKGHDGKMYFGSIAGMTVFDPLKAIPVNIKNTTTISRIRILNDDIYPARVSIPGNMLTFDGSKLTGIRIHESDKAFSVEFSALNYMQADKIKYAYRLKGFDNNWTEVSSERRFAGFTNIKNGKYELEVKCTNADGSWSDQMTVLKITVIPPFYKTWWFILFLAITLVYATYRFYKYRIQSLRLQEAHLRQLVDERTHEIEQQKEQLSEQAIQLQSNVKMLMKHQDEVSRQNEMLVEQNQKITHQKEELEELTRKLEEATIDKIGFFTNITHEFRTPITLILGPVERALKLSTNPKVLEQLNIVRRNSRLLLSLINQLMDFRKVESGKMELTKSQQNFVEFLDDLILPFEDLVKDRGISFSKQYRIHPPEFMFDKDNLQKVIGNLLSNAIKFTPDFGQITVVASTYTDKKDHKEKLYLAVKDTGKGISEDEKEKLFDRFYQSRQNMAYSGSGQSGTGIGLYLCKQIIELHNGKIEAMNRHDGGSCFRFIIPIERRLSTVVSVDGKVREMIVESNSSENDSISGEMAKGKPVLLIVEDNSDMRQYIRSIMTPDYNVLEAPNGVVGLEITNRYQPDLIISDIMMPEMDGMEFCKRVKTNFTTSHIPVVLLTAKSSTDTQIESFHLGADAFLVKPFDEDLLKAIIANLSEKRKKMQLNFAESMDVEALNIDDESLDKKFMDKAMRILKENYTNPDFDVTEFIDAMGISRSLLHKKLTNLAGQSASRFIRIFRLNIGRELLIKNRVSHAMNISEIAYEVGFNDPKYFTRCFTKHFGTQPSTFMDEE